MDRNKFWLVLSISFLSAVAAVLIFAFLVDNQIGELRSQIDLLEQIVKKYGLEDEVDKTEIEYSSYDDLALNQIKNASYRLDLPELELSSFRLVNGEYVNQRANITQNIYIDLSQGEEHQGIDYLIVNLDQDQEKEALVILNYSTGGTGVFKYLAFLDNMNGSAKHIDTISLAAGEIKSLSYSQENNLVAVEMIAYGDDDPNCCPSQEETKYYYLENSQLIRKND